MIIHYHITWKSLKVSIIVLFYRIRNNSDRLSFVYKQTTCRHKDSRLPLTRRQVTRSGKFLNVWRQNLKVDPGGSRILMTWRIPSPRLEPRVFGWSHLCSFSAPSQPSSLRGNINRFPKTWWWISSISEHGYWRQDQEFKAIRDLASKYKINFKLTGSPQKYWLKINKSNVACNIEDFVCTW